MTHVKRVVRRMSQDQHKACNEGALLYHRDFLSLTRMAPTYTRAHTHTRVHTHALVQAHTVHQRARIHVHSRTHRAGPNLSRSRNSRASRATSRRTTQTDGCLLPEPLREVASTATLAALAVAGLSGE